MDDLFFFSPTLGGIQSPLWNLLEHRVCPGSCTLLPVLQGHKYNTFMDEVASSVSSYVAASKEAKITASSSSPSSSASVSHLSRSVDILIDTLRIFGGSSVAISFNGGKDACVILYLLMAALQSPRTSESLQMLGGEIKVVYFAHELEFTEMTSFLGEVSHYYVAIGSKRLIC